MALEHAADDPSERGKRFPGAEFQPGEADAPVSYRAVLGNPHVRVLAGSRAASRAAQTTLNYGSMVYLSTAGASQLSVSLVGSTSYVAPLFFGVQGGSVADSLSKRIALAAGFGIQAALCLLLPILLGTSVGSLIFLMFMTSLLMQVVTPSLKAAVAIVATPSQLATTNAVIALVGSVASAIGSTMLAPVLISFSGLDAVLYCAAALFALGAVRALSMEREDSLSIPDALRNIQWKPASISLRANGEWIFTHRPIATMILTGAIVSALFEAFTTLIPVYVRDVLNANPAHTVYIFAPAGVGFLLATAGAPWIILRFGERRLATIALACMTVGMTLFGLIRIVAPIFAPISPLRLMGLFGVELSDEVLAAAVIAIPANFGSTAAGAAVDNFVNRHVPVSRQGATFGLKDVQDNALTLFTILTLGVLANFVGSRIVMIVAPLVATSAVLLMLRYSFRQAGKPLMSRREAFRLLVSDHEQPASS